MKNNEIPSTRSLSEKQEALLSRFYDGECSCVSAFLARRLIAKRDDAKSFVADLERVKSECRAIDGAAKMRTTTIDSVDLWDRIDARIEQEQRAALYLGSRRLQQRTESLWQRISLRHSLIGGFSGAAVAAALLLVLTRPSQIMTFSAPVAAPLTRPQLVQPVGIGGGAAQNNRYQVSSAKAHNPLEVDWMRANGSLKLIPDPSGSSAIIWVRRRSLPSTAPATQRVVPRLQATPLGLAVIGSGGQRLPLDEHQQPGAK